MPEFDVTVIGAGLIGLAIASELAAQGRQVAVLERWDSFGRETSSRNSEVIHGGMYYPTGSLKARMCVLGRRLLYEFCQKNRIPCKKTGKLIVATEKEEVPALEKIYALGKANDVEGLEFLDETGIRLKEPQVKGICAVFSPETGIVDSHQLMNFLCASASTSGAIIAFNSEVRGIEKVGEGFRVMVRNLEDDVALTTRLLVNSAGLDSDMVAEMSGLDVKKRKYELYYCKGQYFRVRGKTANVLKHMVYPVPEPKSGGLGIHVTLDMSGGMRLGPDAVYMKNRIKDYDVPESKRQDFYDSAVKFLPFLRPEDLYPDTSGIRPKLHDETEKFRDFVIQDEAPEGLDGLINLIGIESPGLTSSLSIAKCVASMAKKYFS